MVQTGKRSSRWIWAALLAGIAAAGSMPEATGRPAAGVTPPEPLAEPPELVSNHGVLDTTLVCSDQGTPIVAGRPLSGAWTYHNGDHAAPLYPGPTLHVNPGDTLRIRYVNALPDAEGVMQETNLHTHGLHVSPQGNADNVLLRIPSGAENQYVIRIPKDHPQGLYWYHPHLHGLAEGQLAAGLVGMIVVGRADGGAPELDRARQRLMTLQVTYSPGDEVSHTSPPYCKQYATQGSGYFSDLQNLHFTINGQANPRIDIQPGELQVWSFLNASTFGHFALRLRGTGGTQDQPLALVAQDGNPMTRPVMIGAERALVIPPGARFSVLVAGPAAGTYQLQMDAYYDGFFRWPPSFGADVIDCDGTPLLYSQEQPLATVVSSGTPLPAVPLPRRLTPPTNAFERLDQARVDEYRTAHFSSDAKNQRYQINGKVFPENPVFQPRLNSVEEWELLNGTVALPYSEQHPFHIHANGFQLQSLFDPAAPASGVSVPQTWFQDIVNMPNTNTAADGTFQPSRTVVRLRPRDFLGTYVYHCHRIDHEDRGMMALISIIPEMPIYAAAGGRGTAPQVTVFNALTDRAVATFNAFERRSAAGGVRIAVGDVDGDSVMDVAAVPGPGGPPRVRVFSGRRGFRTRLLDFAAFDSAYAGGLQVATGDIDSDGCDDLIVAPGAGGPPEVRVFSGKSGAQLARFMAYEETFRGGVNVASAIVGDGGRYSIVTGPGAGRAPEVRVFDVDWYGAHMHGTAKGCCCGSVCACPGCGVKSCAHCAGRGGSCACGAPTTLLSINQTAAVTAYGNGYTGGVQVGMGPVDALNGGFAAVVTTPATGVTLAKCFVLSGGHDHGKNAAESPVLTEKASGWVYPPNFTGGATVATVSTSTGADLVIGPGPGAALPLVRLRYDAASESFNRVSAGQPFGPRYAGGMTAAAR